MKKHILILILFLFTLNSYSQQNGMSSGWVTVGLKGGAGISALLNSNVNNDENVNINYFTTSYNYGAKVGVGLSRIGLYYEFMPGYVSAEYNLTDPIKNTKILGYKTLEHIILIRFIGEDGAWFEIGPKFIQVRDLTVENSVDGNYNDISNDLMNSNYASLCAGFGFSAYIGDKSSLAIGPRVSYSFSDLVNDNTHQIVNDGVYSPEYDSYEQSNPLTIQITVEFTYDIAYFGKTKCKRRRIMFFK